VVLVGNTSATSANQGLNGYGSLSDAAAGTTPAAVIFVVDDVLKTLDRASLVTSLDGMFRTVGGNLAFSLTPTVANSWVTFEGTSKVVFQAKGGAMVTVHVVGADGYTSINAAMTDAHAGDVVYIADNALTAATSYQVFKENMTFMANSSTFNNQLTLALGDLQTADGSLEIKNLFLLGDANINVNGNQHNNFVVGNRGNNIIQGGDGNDVIATGGGADKIYGGLGSDTLIATSVRAGFLDSTVNTAALLSGGAGNDLLINSTTDSHKVNMTGGADADVFKFAGLSEDNGALSLSAVITDLSARSGDDLDFTQILKANVQVTNANQLSATYSGGNLTYNFASTANFSTSSSDTTINGAEVLDLVGLTGSVQVYMTTTSNAASALVLATPEVTSGATVVTPANNGTTAHQDVFGGSLSAEMLKLMPMFDQNTLG
jgi:Ca2+-binding RTX toxin-like protein